MIQLSGLTAITIKSPKVGNLETVSTGVTMNTSRRGVVGSIILDNSVVKKRRFDFERLKLDEKILLENFVIANYGRVVSISWVHGSSEACNLQSLVENYLLDDQPLEFITIRDAKVSSFEEPDLAYDPPLLVNRIATYDCSTYWTKV